MKKNEKILIGILIFILIIMCGVLFLTKTVQKQNVSANISDNEGKQNANGENNNENLGRIVKVDNKLYYDLEKESEHKFRCRSNGWENSI
ncbi:MAG: hypothetical protein HFJ51_01940 [Clostridia bacterium]|nr:hypothetical protein [Clostridia bacterium]